MKYRLSDDKETINFIKQRLVDNDGYCPSVMDSRGIENYKCPCDDFMYNVGKGETCRCGLYVKVKK
jgi:ferredoxin-thioredoxin reductase catalytic subunit